MVNVYEVSCTLEQRCVGRIIQKPSASREGKKRTDEGVTGCLMRL